MAEQRAIKSPLTDKHYQDLKRLQKNIKATREYLLKCDRCKLDVEAETQQTDEQLEVVRNMLKEFFPDKPLD